jgi:hypothetical protein
MKRFAIAALATFGIVLAAGPGARAQNTSCSTNVTGVVVQGNLVVPTGATCTLNGVTVEGNVLVRASATLNVATGSKIGGNIEAERCNYVVLLGNPIAVVGNLEIENCALISGIEPTSGPTPGITIGGNFVCENNANPCLAQGGKVGGNVSFINNSGGSQLFRVTIGGNLSVNENSCTLSGCEVAVVVDSTVGGNVEVNNNSGPGDSTVGANVIHGNLRCQGNTPGISDDNVGPNTVDGKKLGQCAGL